MQIQSIRWALPTLFLRICLVPLSLAGICTFSFAASTDGAIFVLARDVSLSDGLPVRNLSGDWKQGYDPKEPNPRALRSTQFQIGWRGIGGDYSLIERKEAFLAMSADTATLLSQYQQKSSPLVPSTNRSAQSHFLGWHGRGFEWQTKSFDIQNTQLQLTAQGFRLLALRQYETQGSWGTDGQGGYDYDVQAHDEDSRQSIPPGVTSWGAPSSQGWGWSLSLGLTHRFNEAHTLRLNATDAISQLRWSGVTAQDERLNSSIKARNSEGYIDYAASVTGRYSSADALAKIPAAWSGQWLWEVNPSWETSITWSERFGIQQRWLAADYRADSIRWGFGIEPIRQGKKLAVGHQYWQASLAWDQASASTGKLLSWGLMVAIPIK